MRNFRILHRPSVVHFNSLSAAELHSKPNNNRLLPRTFFVPQKVICSQSILIRNKGLSNYAVKSPLVPVNPVSNFTKCLSASSSLDSCASLDESSPEEEEILNWVTNNIKCVSRIELLDTIGHILADENELSRNLMTDADCDNVEVCGSFVSRIDIFNTKKNSRIVKKIIPQGSQLAFSHRGFYVNPAYSYGQHSGLGVLHDPVKEYRPLVNLLMVKRMAEELNIVSPENDVCQFLMIPTIYVSSNFSFYQIMPYVDTSVKITNQMLPKDGDKIALMTKNICNAACLANVTMQADCMPSNFCFIKDEMGDIVDIRMFDCDVVDAGDVGDISEIYDFTQPKNFIRENSSFQICIDNGSCYDARAALPPLVSAKLFDVVTKKLSALAEIANDYAGENFIPFVLQSEGLIDRWKDRVMILTGDNKLYKNIHSSESIEFDHTAALFVLKKLHCVNSNPSLFIDMSFRNLEEKYDELVSSEREKELNDFFKEFLPNE